jgi:hypothetical protein
MQQPRTESLLHFCASSNESSDICDTQFLTMYTFAAYLPEELSLEDRRLAKNFFSDFSDQCRHPTIGGLVDVEKQKLEFGSRRELVLSLCTMENVARTKLDLPLNQCRYGKLMQRWRYADGYL